jgi:D-glycero-alpha-D-manno-heptose-7-phosphate kinase
MPGVKVRRTDFCCRTTPTTVVSLVGPLGVGLGVEVLHRAQFMIISRTPFRISFFGGGTDYPDWTDHEDGAVLSTAIDKYCYISCRYYPPFFNVKHRIVWSKVELPLYREEIVHPAVREGMKYLGFDDSVGLEIHHQGDLPARAGMGSSSSFAVGLIKALQALRGQIVGKQRLAEMAIELEQKVLNEKVGAQDQVAAAYGGFNVIRFRKQGRFLVEPVTIPKSRLNELESHLLLFYTGTDRLASEVASHVVANLQAKAASLRTMRAMVDEGVDILSGSRSLDDFGRLLHESWLLKRSISSAVSNTTIDGVYDLAIKHGALGGKLLGAGAAGFMVFYVPLEKKAAVIKGLSNFLHVDFRFEPEGSSIIFYGTSS